MSDLVFVADVHLVEDDPEALPFHEFLRSLAGNTRTCVIVGDLFNVWIARRRFVSPGQRRLLDVVREVSRCGVAFKYVEGNRDYFVGENWTPDPFAGVAAHTLVEAAGPTRLLVAHGDQINPEDRPYRLWRAFSRSLPVRAGLGLLPGALGRGLGNGLERRLRGTNLRNKSRLPEDHLRAYARQAVAAGHSGVVLGHFHVETRMAVEGGTLWILPDWKEGHRYLRFTPDGHGSFMAAA